MDTVKRVRIAGTGAFLPEDRLTNAMLEARGIGTTEEWILERTGIHERRVVKPGTAVSEMTLPAARQALEAAGLGPDELDAIVFGTSTPDSISPPSASAIARQSSSSE